MTYIAKQTAYGTVFIDDVTGEAGMSQSTYCELSGKHNETIARRKIKGVRFKDTKMVEVLTLGGLQGVRFLPAKVAFAWAVKDKPELAIAMGEAGATIYIHQLAGFTINSSGSTELDKTLKLLWNTQRDMHKMIYHHHITSTEANKLHQTHYGMDVNEWKAKHPLFVEAVVDDKANEYFAPDHSDVEQLMELNNLRKEFVRAKQFNRSNPYLFASNKVKAA